jgi:hypothetical protein
MRAVDVQRGHSTKAAYAASRLSGVAPRPLKGNVLCWTEHKLAQFRSSSQT